jgi:methyl coenzyme M reductase subunit C-like uncharacterized protein (methanogenesis marker protein 7)
MIINKSSKLIYAVKLSFDKEQANTVIKKIRQKYMAGANLSLVKMELEKWKSAHADCSNHVWM